MKSEQEHQYTSTGIKYWNHSEQMLSYKEGTGRSIISTHISPEGSCNLNCSYCSVKKRTQNFRIELPVIQDYVIKLMSRGLKAVILTGGGEPTLYPQINELLHWLKHTCNLKIALITNGTQTHRVDDWSVFEWIRVSLNDIPNWKEVITLPTCKIPNTTVIGCSYIDTGDLLEKHKDLSSMLDKLNAKYLRVLPNCLLDQKELLHAHAVIKSQVAFINDPRYFHQFKIHGTPKTCTCHQSYFRPYLSEIDGGTVYPCDSLVLNDNVERFDEKYRLCKAGDVLDFLDKKIQLSFNPQIDCSGCVFFENVNMLDDWYNNKLEYQTTKEGIQHVEFV
jgi:MoaA/NifB/PqqE/SkfB family radical SAM enzyme